jgi:hypothetical protein
MNNKYQRYAMELILFIACNTRDVSSKIDLEILSLLSKIRLQKSRQVQNVFQSAIRFVAFFIHNNQKAYKQCNDV